MSLTLTEKEAASETAKTEEGVAELAEQKTKSKTLLLLEDKLELLKKLDEFIDRFLASPIKDRDELKSESRELANKVAELFPRDDEFSYQGDKQLLFDVFFAEAYSEYDQNRFSETKKRIAKLTTSLVELQQKVTLAFEHSFSLGQLVCDSNHNLFMVIKILSDPELGTTTLKLIAQDGKEISGSATDYSLSEDVTSIPSFIDQVAHHWKVYGSSEIRQAWIGRAETPYRNAKEAWSSLNTAARKFSGSAR